MSLTLHTKRNVGVLLSHMSLTLHSKRDVGVLSSDMPLTLHSKKDVGVLSSDMSLPLHTKRNVGVYWYPLNLSLMSYVEDIVIFLGLSVFSRGNFLSFYLQKKWASRFRREPTI